MRTHSQCGRKREQEADLVERSHVLSVDAGSAHVRAVLAEVSKDGSRLIGVGEAASAGIRRGAVTDLAAAVGAIQTAVTRACSSAGLAEVPQAVLGISGAHLRTVAGAAEVAVHRPSAGITALDIRRALDAAAAVELPEGRESIHVLPRGYQVDGAEGVSDPLGLAGRSLRAEVTVVTGDAYAVQNGLRAATAAGLQLLDYGVGARAAGEAVLTHEERMEGVLHIDLGGGTTTVAVWEEGHLWDLIVLPVGSDHITADVATVLRIPLHQAEALKRERGWASPQQADLEALIELPSPSGLTARWVKEGELAQIIGSRVEEILQLAANGVKRSGYTGLFPAGLVLSGGGSHLRGLVSFAGDALGLPARQAATADPLAPGPEWSTAVGLVQWGIRRLATAPAAAAAEPISPWRRVKDWLAGLFH
jgi:cell division protein FtsA